MRRKQRRGKGRRFPKIREKTAERDTTEISWKEEVVHGDAAAEESSGRKPERRRGGVLKGFV